MNDIVLNGETLEISNVIDTIVIEGFDHTFTDGKVESNLTVNASGGGGSTLITKTFDQNGTYSAATYSADGFSEVTVDVPGDDTNIWQGTKEEFSNLSVRNPKTVYNVYKPSMSSSRYSCLYQIWIGNTRVFPPVKDGYEFWVQNYDQSSVYGSKASAPNSWIDTGIALFSSDNISRPWQIEFRISYYDEYNIDHIICGCDKSEGIFGFRELYINGAGSNKCLYLYDYGTQGHDDEIVSNTDFVNVDCVLKKENGVYTFYQNGVATASKSVSATQSNTMLGVGMYSSDYGIGVYFDYFGFKWLD